jgi:DNA topoisomerase-2
MDRAAKYRKLTPLQHVVSRPGMYVGSVQVEKATRWVVEIRENTPVLVRKEVEYVPALLKLFDEAVTNALDASAGDPTLKTIKITITGSTIGIRNCGAGIPVVNHVEYKCFVPEMIFGQLHSGENFNEDRQVGGQNGLGVKLCNIFSTKFSVSTRDALTGSTWDGEWTDGMTKFSVPNVKICEADPEAKPKPGFVEVTFSPQASLLAPHGTIDADLMALFARRALDVSMAAREGVKVTFNGTTLAAANLKRYAQLFVGTECFLVVDESNPRWRVAVAYSEEPFAVGLLNGVSAVGQHVSRVEYQLYDSIIKALENKKDAKGLTVKQATLKQHVGIFVVAVVNGPNFNSQTKETCVSWSKADTGVWVPPDAFINKVIKSPIVSSALADETVKLQRKMARETDGKKTATVSVPKLIDAAWAGTARSGQTALILTEGDSARSFAVSGLSVLGHDRYGVFPLKGKLLNVREATVKKYMENAEVKNLKTILGLQEGKTHAGGVGLRYGSILVLTDADRRVGRNHCPKISDTSRAATARTSAAW